MFQGLLGALNMASSQQEGAQPQLNTEGIANMLDQVVNKVIKFKTAQESFNRNYPKVDHLQQWFNDTAIDRFVQIITNKYKYKQAPLCILDLCCGYGLTTLTLRDRLIKNGVEIEKIVGYDVSEDMISFDQGKNTHYPQVDFRKKNIETELDDIAQYDVAYCLFGLHWMNDLDHVLHCVNRALKPRGIFLSLTPIEIHDLFDMRTAFVNNSKWTDAIEGGSRTLHPFHYDEQIYRTPLTKYFSTKYDKKKETKFEYTRKQFRDFLHSWLQEVRHLTNDVSHEVKKEAIANAFIDDFIDSIPKNLNGNVIIRDDGSIIYTQHTYDFDGEKYVLEEDKVGQ